jgi:hypothetical protein
VTSVVFTNFKQTIKTMAEIELSLLLASNAVLNTAFALSIRRKLEKRKRRFWVRQWIGRRNALGVYSTLLQELRDEDVVEFTSYMRMDIAAFEELYSLVEPAIVKLNTKFRDSIPGRQRLAVTLRFLATGQRMYVHNVAMFSFTTAVIRNLRRLGLVLLKNSNKKNGYVGLKLFRFRLSGLYKRRLINYHAQASRLQLNRPIHSPTLGTYKLWH